MKSANPLKSKPCISVKKTALVIAIGIALYGNNYALATTYTPDVITGDEDFFKDTAVKQIKDQSLIYTFQDGDIVNPLFNSFSAIDLRFYSTTPNINKVIFKNLNIQANGKGSLVKLITSSSTQRELVLENSKLKIENSDKIRGFVFEQHDANIRLNNTALDVNGGKEVRGVTSSQSSFNNTINATNLDINLKATGSAIGYDLDGKNTKVNADSLNLNIHVQDGGWSFNNSTAMGIVANNESSVTNKNTNITITSATKKDLDSKINGVISKNGSNVALGLATIDIKSDIDSGKINAMSGLDAHENSHISLDSGSKINVLANLKYHTENSSLRSDFTGVMADGLSTIKAYNSDINVNVLGQTHEADNFYINGLLVGHESNKVTWGNGNISVNADVDAASNSSVNGVKISNSTNANAIDLGNVNIKASVRGVKSNQNATGDVISFSGVELLGGSFTMQDGTISSLFTGDISDDSYLIGHGILVKNSKATMGNGDITTSIAGTLANSAYTELVAVETSHASLVHGNGNIKASVNNIQNKQPQKLAVYGVYASDALTWGNGNIVATGTMQTDTKSANMFALYNGQQGLGSVTLGKTNIATTVTLDHTNDKENTQGAISIGAIYSKKGDITKGDGDIVVDVKGGVGHGNYLSLAGANISNGNANLSNANILVKGDFTLNNGYKTAVYGIKASDNASLKLLDGSIGVETVFNKNAYTLVSAISSSTSNDTMSNNIDLGNVSIKALAHAYDGFDNIGYNKGMYLTGIDMEHGVLSMKGGSIEAHVDGVTKLGQAIGVSAIGSSSLNLGTTGKVDINVSTSSTDNAAIGIFSANTSKVTYNGGNITSSLYGIVLKDSTSLVINGDSNIYGLKTGVIINKDNTLDVNKGNVYINSTKNDGAVNVKQGALLAIGGIDDNATGTYHVYNAGTLSMQALSGQHKLGDISVDANGTITFNTGLQAASRAFFAAPSLAQYQTDKLVNNGSVRVENAILDTGASLSTTDKSHWDVASGSTLNFNQKTADSSLIKV